MHDFTSQKNKARMKDQTTELTIAVQRSRSQYTIERKAHIARATETRGTVSRRPPLTRRSGTTVWADGWDRDASRKLAATFRWSAVSIPFLMHNPPFGRAHDVIVRVIARAFDDAP